MSLITVNIKNFEWITKHINFGIKGEVNPEISIASGNTVHLGNNSGALSENQEKITALNARMQALADAIGQGIKSMEFENGKFTVYFDEGATDQAKIKKVMSQHFDLQENGMNAAAAA